MNKSMYNVWVLGICATLLVTCASGNYVNAGQEVDDSKARNMKLSVRNKEIYIGDLPFMLMSYDSSGKSAGMGFLSLSADLRNTILDISEIPDESPALGVQVERGRTVVSIVNLNRKMCKCNSAFIDSNGVVFPDKIRGIEEGGPFVALMFMSTDNNQISLQDLQIEVLSETQKGYNIRQAEGDILIIEGVPREPIEVRIRSTAVGREWTGILFPAFRSATRGVVLYSIKNVTAGKERPQEGLPKK